MAGVGEADPLEPDRIGQARLQIAPLRFALGARLVDRLVQRPERAFGDRHVLPGALRLGQ